jgi:glycine/D-amino acid oxidase-like deaminating enzyme
VIDFHGNDRCAGMKSFDVVIVGAGIVGSACAGECAQAGLRVGLVEGNTPASGATAAGMGHLVVMDDSPVQLALTQYSRSLWRQLLPQLPSAVEYESRGTLWVAADDEEMVEVHAKRAKYAAAGVVSEVLNASQLAAEEPNLRAGFAGGLLVPDDAVIYPPAAATFFLRQAQALGATCMFGSDAISASDGEVRLADGTRLHGDRIVLATGASTTLLPSLPIKSRKGHLVITDRYPGFLHHQVVELGYLKSAHSHQADSVACNIQPRRTGQILIGSSRQYDNLHPAVDAHMLESMLQRARFYMPGLAKLSALRAWTGFRASTPDNLPLIGPATGLSEDESLWLAVGFEGLGITNAPAAALLLADQMLQRTSAIDTAPYLPQRTAKNEYSHA